MKNDDYCSMCGTRFADIWRFVQNEGYTDRMSDRLLELHSLVGRRALTDFTCDQLRQMAIEYWKYAGNPAIDMPHWQCYRE